MNPWQRYTSEMFIYCWWGYKTMQDLWMLLARFINARTHTYHHMFYFNPSYLPKGNKKLL